MNDLLLFIVGTLLVFLYYIIAEPMTIDEHSRCHITQCYCPKCKELGNNSGCDCTYYSLKNFLDVF